MKLCLGVIATNEEKMLKRFLPDLATAFNGEVVGIDYGSTDGTRHVLDLHCTRAATMVWPNNFGEAKTNLIKLCEGLGYDWLFLLDADETIDLSKVKIMQEAIDKHLYNVYFMPRLNFLEHGVLNADLDVFPDLQARLFRLNVGYHYRNVRHCILYKGEEHKSAWELHDGVVLPIYIRHFKGLKADSEIMEEYKKRWIMEKGQGQMPETEARPSKNILHVKI